MQPRASVVIPTHNRLETLPRAVESVLAQGAVVQELIIVDDGSTDGTDRYLACLAKLHPTQVRTIALQSSVGAAAARNIGAAAALAEYIAFQDSDDVWLCGRLQREVDVLNVNGDLGFVASLMVRISSRGAEVLPRAEHRGVVTVESALAASLISTQTLVARREIIGTHPFDETMRRFQDWDLVIRLAQDSRGIILDEVGTVAFVRQDSLSTNPSAGARSRIAMIAKYADQVSQLGVRARLQLLLSAAVSCGVYLTDNSPERALAIAKLDRRRDRYPFSMALWLSGSAACRGPLRALLLHTGRAQLRQ